MFEKELVIDGKGHLQGRLASIVAKELVSGQWARIRQPADRTLESSVEKLLKSEEESGRREREAWSSANTDVSTSASFLGAKILY